MAPLWDDTKHMSTLQFKSPCQLTWAPEAQAKGLFSSIVDIQAGAWAL